MSKEGSQLPLFPNPGPTLAQARAQFYENLRDGTTCPCCDRYAKMYKRNLNSAMAATLIGMYKAWMRDPGSWIHMISVHNFGLPSRDYGTLEHWGLTEAKGETRKDGNPESGFHRITEKGRDFVEGKTLLRKYVFLYNNTRFDVNDESSFEEIGIKQALGTKFDYDQLMTG